MLIPDLQFPGDQDKLAGRLRWVLTTAFCYLAITKTLTMLDVGLLPYEASARIAGLPVVFKYTGVVALAIEVYFIFGVWWCRLFKTAVMGGVVLTLAGLALSIYSLMFKLNSDCGCGLLGTNEYGLLVQKLLILLVLIYLFKKRGTLDFD